MLRKTKCIVRYRGRTLAAAGLAALFLCLQGVCAQETGSPEKQTKIQPKTIVLDPGHGGLDSGARGQEGAAEKTITMAFASAMAERLKSSYRVVLTRKDDYQVSLFDRTAIANHHQADLFISIHTGAGYRSNFHGISAFYFEGSETRDSAGELPDGLYTEPTRTLQPWEQHRPHLSGKSRYFLALLKNRLSAAYPDLVFSSGGAPMLVLAGARMPAVLIEIGYVTNPMDAKLLNDKARLAALAGHVCDAVDDFFSDNLKL